MLRRLLAILALLTGLVAVGTPAQAGVGALFGVQVERSEKAEAPGRPAEDACVQRQREQQRRGERAAPCRQGRSITIVIPTVQLGSDRAAE